MGHILAIFICSIIFCSSAIFQDNVRITGRILAEDTGYPATFSTAVIYDRTGEKLFAAQIDTEDGTFDFKSVPVKSGKITIVFSCGFNLRKTMEINIGHDKNDIDLGTIYLAPHNESIEKAVVQSSANVEREAGKETYNIDSSYYNAVVNTGDLLNKIPLLKVQPNSQSAGIVGKNNVLVMVNGINTGESVDLRRINFRDIKKVELMTLPPSNIDKKYDGVINIILKDEIRQGYETGFDEMLRIPSWDSDFYTGFAYGTDRIKIEFLYSNYYRNAKYRTINTRSDNISGLSYTMDGKSEKGFEMDNTFNVNFDWYITDNDYFNITTQTDLSRSGQNYDYEQYYSGINGETVSRMPQFSKRTGYDYVIGNYTIHYRHKMKKRPEDRFSITGNFGFTEGYDDTRNVFSGNAGTIYSIENSSRLSGSLIFDYHSEPMENLKIDSGIQGFWRNLHSSTDGINKAYNDYTNWLCNAFTDIGFQWKKFGFRLGLKVENNANIYRYPAYGSNNMLSFQPSAGIIFRANSKNSIESTYRRTATYPSAWQLTPYTIQYDAHSSLTGNPDLESYIINNVSVTYSYKSEKVKFSTGPAYLKMENIILPYQRIDASFNSDKTFINSGSVDRIAYVTGGSAKIQKWLSLSPEAVLFYDIFNTLGNRRRNFHYSLGISMNIYLPHNMSIYTGAYYKSKRIITTGYAMPNCNISVVNFRKNLPSIGMAVTLSYWQPFTSPDYYKEFFKEYTVTDYSRRTNLAALMIRLEWYISGKKELKKTNVRTYFDTDARSK